MYLKNSASRMYDNICVWWVSNIFTTSLQISTLLLYTPFITIFTMSQNILLEKVSYRVDEASRGVFFSSCFCCFKAGLCKPRGWEWLRLLSPAQESIRMTIAAKQIRLKRYWLTDRVKHKVDAYWSKKFSQKCLALSISLCLNELIKIMILLFYFKLSF